MSLLLSSWRRRSAATLAALAVVAAGLAFPTPAHAKNRVTPGSFTGYGFDQCHTPSQRAMDRWLTHSPYWAVGIYIAGDSRYCKDQPNLDRAWVSRQLRNRWRLLPLTVGRQASCSTVERYKGNRISGDPSGNYDTARAQGRFEASRSVKRAKALGIGRKSTLWYDIEHFDAGRARCRESALSFLSAWTNRLHALGYRSGVYSSASSGIKMLDDAKAVTPRRYKYPDQIWIADWNGKANLHSSFVRPDSWMPHRRIHQYRGGHDERYGGVTINIDSNYLSLGRGSVAPGAPKFCGVRVSFGSYKRLYLGRRDPQVRALQCLLRKHDLYQGEITGRYNRATKRAVLRFQRTRDLRVTGRVAKNSWTALLSAGPAPLSKYGSASNAVRRLQRALNAATGAELAVTGVFERRTTRAVRGYQRTRGLRRTGVVAQDTWRQLQAGRF